MKSKFFILNPVGKRALLSILSIVLLFLTTRNKAQCTPDFSYTIGPNGNVQFSNTSLNVSNAAHYSWFFGDGQSSYGLTNINHSYTSPGSYTVTLDIRDSLFCNVHIAKTLNVSTAPCTASVSFVNRRDTVGSTTWNVFPQYPYGITAASWSWGDGGTSNGFYPSHVYGMPGMYAICVTVTVSCGATGTYCDSSYVYRSAYGVDNSMVTINVIEAKPTGIKSNTWDEMNYVQIYPNPSFNNTALQINAAYANAYKLTVCDVSGKILVSKDLKIEKGWNTIELSTENLKSGLYFVSLSNGTQSKNLRLIKN